MPDGWGPRDCIALIGVYFDSYANDAESGKPGPLRVDKKFRLIISPSSNSAPDKAPTGQIEFDGIINVANWSQTAGTPVHLPTVVEYEIDTTIKANDDNKGNIYLGDENLRAGQGMSIGPDPGNGYILAPGESIKIWKQNADEIFLDADFDIDGISYIMEANNENI